MCENIPIWMNLTCLISYDRYAFRVNDWGEGGEEGRGGVWAVGSNAACHVVLLDIDVAERTTGRPLMAPHARVECISVTGSRSKCFAETYQ